jgi:hypothetical protein
MYVIEINPCLTINIIYVINIVSHYQIAVSAF